MGFLFPGSVRYGVSEQSFRCGQSKSEGRWRFRKSVLLVQKSRSEGDRNSEAHHGRRSRRDSESDLNVEALTSELRSLGPRARSDVVLYKRFHQAIEVRDKAESPELALSKFKSKGFFSSAPLVVKTRAPAWTRLKSVQKMSIIRSALLVARLHRQWKFSL
mmetsp:Transcript_1911/g.7249  ORF Transcript_1911/g.7249 Transcript_1911/m.7249 type:complete len:161 (-) Transcript_1911:6444-6926(-)